jgi:hypothetical protein
MEGWMECLLAYCPSSIVGPFASKAFKEENKEQLYLFRTTPNTETEIQYVFKLSSFLVSEES